MNGILTASESRCLTASECEHYLSLGLCAPLEFDSFERMTFELRYQIEDLEEQMIELSSNLDYIQNELNTADRELMRLRRILDLRKIDYCDEIRG